MADNTDVVRICSKAEVSPGSVKAFAVGSQYAGGLQHRWHLLRHR